MFVKAPRLLLGNWSKALLKACEARIIFVKPDLMSKDTWENDVILCMCCIVEHGEKLINSLQI